ncbi:MULTISPECIES: glycosyltransferase [Pseudomonas]|uniref:glycosyltransferase n=1 Tax=Pseudomonas TaxID=286 RepID=UPI002E2595E9|nr:glycosyltransferase [Pseudomonas sp. JH-2]
MFQLESQGYIFVKAQRYWARPEYSGIAYSDGDFAENRLGRIISGASDLSVLSSELRRQCQDWQTLYHLSSQRANVLRPFEHLLQGKVLEIGAGCGAISRYLGESGGQILSLEGSPRRAAIAASRTRDLENVTVLTERFDDFRTDERFDAITLIGVLEYANMFSDGEHPALNMLERVRELLKPDGHLFIAIENQLGLKYFAGAPEDHLGQAMYGIEGRYQQGQPQTYGRHALEALVRKSGFNSVELLAAFPDYKLPKSVVTAKGCSSRDFDAAALAWQSVQNDPQLPRETHFKLGNTWPVIFENRLSLDLANSFIVVASRDTTASVPEQVLAYHYSTERARPFCKETRFEEPAPGKVDVICRRLSSEVAAADTVNLNLQPNADYSKGQVLSLAFLKCLTTPGWRINELAELIKVHARLLAALAFGSADHPSPLTSRSLLPGELFDAIPQNVICTSDGMQLFDKEWSVAHDIELGYVIFRGLLLMLHQAGSIYPPEDDPEVSRKAFIEHVMAAAELPVNSADLERYIAQEADIQQTITGLDKGQLMNWQPDAPLSPAPLKKRANATLYFTENGEFSEAKSLHKELQAGRQEVEFELNRSLGQISRLRCDPIDQPHWLILHDLVVHDAQSQELWRYSVDSQQATHIGITDVLSNSTLLRASDNDPQVILPAIPEQGQLRVQLDIELLSEARACQLIQQSNQERKQQSQELQNALHDSRQHAEALQQRLVEKDHLTHALNQSINEIRNSTSWRLTRPLRLAGRLSRRALNAARAARHLARQHGWRKLLERGLQVLRREGLRGVIARARQHRRLQMQQPLPPASPLKVIPAVLGRDSAGHYQLARSGGYCYVPPARPDDLEARIAAIGSQPYFSIVVPVYNTPLDLLDKLLASVRDQWYPHWQLILADDKSPAEDIQAALASIDDPRIKVLRLEKNQGISGATNAAIEASDGDFIVFLDHDDELTADCLYEMALCIERDAPDFIYSDEDKLAEDGSYTQPHFKPDWSPDTMMSTMFTCHASCVRKSLLEKTGLLRSQFDGCQDWDFVLRVAEHTRRISHIPKVLYHWRIIPASVASDIAAKPYVLEASRQVRLDALRRRGLAGDVEPVTQVPGYFRVNYHLQGTPRISIIIPSRDNAEVLRRCLDSIRSQTTYANHEIILLDNGSVQPETLAYLESQKQQEGTQVIRHDAPFNFSELNNLGVRYARGDLLLFLNDDTEVLCPDWLERMGGYAQLPHVAAVGAKLLYPDNKGIQHAGVLNLANGPVHAFLHHDSEAPAYFMRNLLEYNWMAVTGACLMMERSKFDTLGGFDESFPVAYNDIELCFRGIEHGYFNVVCQAVTLVHHESVSRGLDQIDPAKLARLQNELARLYQKHPQYFQYDPFHNPNLHPSGLNFEVPA